MIRKFILVGIIIGILAIPSALVFQPSLETLHNGIESDYIDMQHLSADEFLTLPAQDVVIFDVREYEEYEVSHIDGAIQIPPNVDIEEFAEDFSDILDGKTAVFYCSVGRRSSDTLARLTPVLESAGVKSSANLKGGIFNWINQNRALVGDNVHPYNRYWGRLIHDQSRVNQKN